MVESMVVVIYSYFLDLILGWICNFVRKIVVHVYCKTKYFQLVFYKDTSNFKDLPVDIEEVMRYGNNWGLSLTF